RPSVAREYAASSGALRPLNPGGAHRESEGGLSMPVWGWILIAVGMVLLVAIAAWELVAQQRTKRLHERFGPEYDRTLDASKNRREAEARLTARERRHEELDLRPLSHGARVRYADQWERAQSQFVDSPRAAVAAADALIQDVMR